MNLTAFAAERSERLNEFSDEIRPIIASSLAEYGGADWYADIVEGASVLWLEIFEKHSPTGDPVGSIDTFQRELGESLAKTAEPSDPPTKAEVDRVTNWVGVYTVNSATYRAGVVDGGLEKTWITMHDDAVRSMHSAVDGQTVSIRGTFDVGGHKLLFPGEPVGPPEVWINCRCLIATTGGPEMGTKTTSFAVAEAEEEVEAPELTDEELEAEDLVDDETSTPWHGVLVVEGVATGDKRQFDPGALSYRDFPLPIKFQRAGLEGHLGDVVVGTIDSIWAEGSEHRATGRFNNNVPEANEVIDGLIFGMFRGVSIEVDDTEFEVDFKESESEDDEEGFMEMLFGGEVELTRFTKARITGATIVATPAFMEAYVALGDSFDEELRDPNAGVADAGEVDGDTEYDEEIASFDTLEDLIAWLESDESNLAMGELDEHYSLVASAFAPGTHDGPGWITHPRATQRLRSYWTHGEGAAKIRWGTPGDFNRCRKQLSKYVNPAFLAGTCANLHKEAIKVWPGRERGDKRHSIAPSEAFSLVASGAFEVEPEDIRFFTQPAGDDLFPLTVEDDGRVYGYLAAWGTCHLGIGEKCVMPPHSRSEYAHFLRGTTKTTEGDIRTGPLVMWTGHAGTRLSAVAATRHYDDTGQAIADITVGEDALGIWFSGKLRDSVTQEDIKVLRATGTVSGDWRDTDHIGVPDEMIGLLAVNVPGYDMPHPAFAMDGDNQLSLIASAGILAPHKEAAPIVASGFVTAEELDDKLSAVGRIVADELEYRTERRERLSKVRDPELVSAAEERRAARIAAARELE